jgi:hypothetical protein
VAEITREDWLLEGDQVSGLDQDVHQSFVDYRLQV